jgi:hypothetical protein
MKRSAFVLLAVAALAGCGGNDSNDSSSDTAGSTAAAQAPKLEGQRTPAKVAASLQFKPQGKNYTFGKGCKVTGIAVDKAGVAALTEKQGKVGTLVNDRGTAAIHLAKVTYECAIQGKLQINTIP